MNSLTDLREVVDVVIGVDTHVHTHSAAAVNAATGGVLDEITVEATAEGYAQLVEFAGEHATLRAWAIEGTGGHGAGLSRHLSDRQEIVVELDRPKRAKRRNGVDRHEHRYLSHDQVEDLAYACGYPADASKFSSYDTRTNEMYRLVVLFLAYTGVRFGEMAALTAARLDLRRHRAIIAASVSPVSGQGLVWGPPKTHGRREVSIPPFLVAELREYVSGKRGDDLVFAGIRNGAPLRVSTCRTAFGAAAKAIGVPDLYPHQLRHTAASLAIASGADVKVVQQMLGHASATMTLDTYGHLFGDRLDEVGSAMDAARRTSQERRAALRAGVAVARVLPQPSSPGTEKGPCPALPQVRIPCLTRTPDGIRTRATALRGRRARPLHNGGQLGY